MQDIDDYIPLTNTDKEAERLLSLVVMFENASRPIPTATVLSTVYGYCISEDTARKAFMRDRQKLVLCGVQIIQHSDTTGTTTWTINDRETYASNDTLLTPQEATALSIACESLVNDVAFPYANELRLALSKIDRTYDARPHTATNAAVRELTTAHQRLESAAADNHPVHITYHKADGTSIERTLGICGFFSARNNTYLVGQKLPQQIGDEPHSYNLARVESVHPITKQTYVPPSDFDIRDYPILPFQIGPIRYTAVFKVDPSEIDNLTVDALGKGTLFAAKDGHVIHWRITVSDTNKAAAWAIAHAIQPIEPYELIARWEEILLEIVNHESDEQAV